MPNTRPFTVHYTVPGLDGTRHFHTMAESLKEARERCKKRCRHKTIKFVELRKPKKKGRNKT